MEQAENIPFTGKLPLALAMILLSDFGAGV
jgi:hypothetical protein